MRRPMKPDNGSIYTRQFRKCFFFGSVLMTLGLYLFSPVGLGAAPFSERFQFSQPGGVEVIPWGQGGGFEATVGLEAPGPNVTQQPLDLATITSAGDLRDDISEPAQATLPLENVLVSEGEGEKAAAGAEPTTIFSDTFEGSFPGASWTLSASSPGSPTWNVVSYDKHGGSRSAWCGGSSLNPADGYTDNMNAMMIYGPFSLADTTSANLSFWYKNYSEACCDFFGWYASIDGVNFYGNLVSGNQNSWRQQVFDLASVPTIGDLRGRAQVWIAFKFASDGSLSGNWGYTGAYVDDVVISAVSSLPDLTPTQPYYVFWNDKIPIGITRLDSDEIHNYSGPYYDDQTLYFNWYLGNLGTVDAGSYIFRREVTGSGGGTWEYTIPFHPPNIFWLYGKDQAVGPLSAGVHTFKLWVDYDNRVRESNETNNYYERTITVHTRSDFNNDGKADMVWRNRSTGELVVWFMNGVNMGNWSYFNPSPLHTAWETVGTGDFDGDGRTDILLRNSPTGELVVWFTDGINMSSWSYLNPSPVHTSWKVLGVEDFSSDGKPDILWRNSSTGEFVVWFMNGVNMTSWSYFNPSPIHASWETVGTGDFSGDGKPDVLWRNSGTGEFVVWFMDGINMTSSNYFNPSPVHTAWETVGTRDFNGDRKTDIVWWNSETGEFVVWFMDGINMTSWSYFNPSPVDTTWVPLGAKWNRR